QVKFSHPQVTLAGNVEAVLDQRIRDLSARTAALALPTPLNVLINPGFEAPIDKSGKIPGWEVSNPAAVKRDNDKAYKGEPAALRLSNPGGVLTVRSEPFEPPTTGRLSVAVGLRVEQIDQQPQLRLAIEGLLDGKLYYRFASVGAGQNIAKLSDRYAPYIFQVDDLPTTGLTQLRVRFDMIDEGSVLIDNVQLYDLAFNDSERIELTKIITSANIALHSGKTSDCVRVLEGYWPRYLTEHVPLVQTAAAAQSKESPTTKAPEKTAEKPGAWDKLRRSWPF
ncbi:MAG TPA: hypothetical protein VFE24_02160, partial [Pirellulales bacterium]|nr:hypothetical protein [Pirellulales bacterium]